MVKYEIGGVLVLLVGGGWYWELKLLFLSLCNDCSNGFEEFLLVPSLAMTLY